ncbi:MAG: hypothetical protein O2973_13740 [Gemmatimonadetes bacterium]|nr:hypothetical protein [Gemmatimonadota bacterium]
MTPMHRLNTVPGDVPVAVKPRAPTPVRREDRARDDGRPDHRLPFTSQEAGEFLSWIRNAPASDLPRHERRLSSAKRLGCLTVAQSARLAQAIEERHRELPPPGVPSMPEPTNPPTPPTADELERLLADTAALKLAQTAAIALHAAHCTAVELFLPQVTQRLRLAPDGDVQVLDDDGTKIAAALAHLRDAGLIRSRPLLTAGRSAEVWITVRHALRTGGRYGIHRKDGNEGGEGGEVLSHNSYLSHTSGSAETGVEPLDAIATLISTGGITEPARAKLI